MSEATLVHRGQVTSRRRIRSPAPVSLPKDGHGRLCFWGAPVSTLPSTPQQTTNQHHWHLYHQGSGHELTSRKHHSHSNVRRGRWVDCSWKMTTFYRSDFISIFQPRGALSCLSVNSLGISISKLTVDVLEAPSEGPRRRKTRWWTPRLSSEDLRVKNPLVFFTATAFRARAMRRQRARCAISMLLLCRVLWWRHSRLGFYSFQIQMSHSVMLTVAAHTA